MPGLNVILIYCQAESISVCQWVSVYICLAICLIVIVLLWIMIGFPLHVFMLCYVFVCLITVPASAFKQRYRYRLKHVLESTPCHRVFTILHNNVL